MILGLGLGEMPNEDDWRCGHVTSLTWNPLKPLIICEMMRDKYMKTT